MSYILLLQIDGKLPNIALMRIAAHHRGLGDHVELRHAPTFQSVERGFWDNHDLVYASAIFERSRPIVSRLKQVRPDAIVGGTGIDLETTLESIGITTREQDYSDYPKWRQSIGFTQRGCRLKCPFCVVPKTEGKVRRDRTIMKLWRGDPWPRELILLDNDFFGEPTWPEQIEAIRDGRFKACFSQGINARALTDETAAAVASISYFDDQMKTRRIYTAWDNRKDESRLFRGLDLLVKHGVKPDHIMVYMLIGYWDGETEQDREHRRQRLREFGARPYPMPFTRAKELVDFQRWVVGAYDKRISWQDWKRASGRPERLSLEPMTLFDERITQ